ncbi:MAG: T9SS type A sorting domain-containing protein, partial [Bacteroidales bacterium]|nr:T9SS type A sorting domain-containing protein [Bacteroidales bacterium]
IYPNPCGETLYVELPDHVQSIGLMSLTGQDIRIPRSMHGNRVSFDLSQCSRGIYLLKIREKSGSIRCFKIVHQ